MFAISLQNVFALNVKIVFAVNNAVAVKALTFFAVNLHSVFAVLSEEPRRNSRNIVQRQGLQERVKKRRGKTAILALGEMKRKHLSRQTLAQGGFGYCHRQGAPLTTWLLCVWLSLKDVDAVFYQSVSCQ